MTKTVVAAVTGLIAFHWPHVTGLTIGRLAARRSAALGRGRRFGSLSWRVGQHAGGRGHRSGKRRSHWRGNSATTSAPAMRALGLGLLFDAVNVEYCYY
ncbi:MAG: hypothetical protein WBO09_06560 [Methylocystis silviterrae]|uniref:hypothetical protein n=1 Tax=Methylocystis silviterrae TaxID=2743612 RepID=UPI003C7312F7